MQKMFSAPILILILALSLISCEKEETDLIIGQWEGISERIVNYKDNVIVHDSTYTYKSEEFVMEILADGTCKTYEYGTMNKTWSWKVEDDIFSLIEGHNSRGAQYTVSEDALNMDFLSEWDEQGVGYKRIYYYVFRRMTNG